MGKKIKASDIIGVLPDANLPGIDFSSTDFDVTGTTDKTVNINAARIISILTANGVTVTPPAPTGGIVDDTANTFTFTLVPGYTASLHEYSTNNGSSYSDCSSNVISVGNVAIASGSLKVRVKAGANRNAGGILSSTSAFTVPDVTSPTVVSAGTSDSTHIQVIFNEAVTVTTAGWSFTKNGSSLAITSVSGSGTTWSFLVGQTMISSDVLLSSYDSSTGATLDLAGNEIVAFLGQPITNNISGVQIVPFAANTGVTANTSTGDVTLAANGNGTWSTMLLDLDTVGSYVEWTQPATTSLSRFFTVAIGSTQTVTANGFDARIYENFSYYFIRGTNNLGAGDVAVPWVAGQKCRLYLDTTDLLYQTSPDNGVTWETKNTESNIAAAKRGSHIPAYVLVTTTTANTKQLAIKAKGLIPFQIKIIFDGDSITQGANTTTGFANSNVMAVTSNMDYPAQLYRKSTRFAQCRNFGISAQKITDMMADFNTEIAPLINTTLFSKNVLVCWGGTNDIATGTSGGLTTFNNVKSYCLNARSFGFKVVVCNMIARTGLFSGGLTTGSFATEQAIFNSNIASDWATFADAFVDVNGLNLQSTTGWDGVHPADAGYTLAANAIYTGVMSV